MVEVPNSKDKLDKVSGVRPSSLVITRPDNSSEDEEEEMALNQRKGLRDLMVRRNKGTSSKEVPKSQDANNLPHPSPPPTIALGLLPIPNLKKKRKD